MDFALSSEQLLLQATARDLFTARSGMAASRAALDGDTGAVPDLRPELGSLGLLGILSSEDGDGGGCVLDLAVVAEQAGRALAVSPLVATAAWAAPVLRRAAADGSAGAERLLAEVVSGRLPVTAVDARGLRLDGGALTGDTAPAIDAGAARTVLTVVDDALVASEIGYGLTADCGGAVDPTRQIAVLRARGAPVEELHRGPGVRAAWERGRQVAAVVLAAEDLGTAGEALRRAVEYARERHAFGRPIGGFQAVKHALVDALVLEEQLRSLVWMAAHTADRTPADLPLHAAAAAAHASDTVDSVTRTLIQVHGGIGVTWEHDAHLLWRRAQVDRLLLGDACEHRERLATLLLAREGVA